MDINADAYGLGGLIGSIIGGRVADRNKRRKATKDAQMVEVLQNPTSTEKSMGYDEYLQNQGDFYRKTNDDKLVHKYNNALLGADQGLLQDLVSGKYDSYGQVEGTRLNPSALESLKQAQQLSGEIRLPQGEKQAGLFASLQPDSGYTLQYSPPQPVAENKGLIASVFPKDKPEITSNEKYKGPLSMALEYQQKPTVDTNNLTDEQKTLIGMFKSGQISKEHASKFLDFNNRARQTYEAEVPNVTSYLSEAQMLKKALENGYSASEAKDIVSLARMDINKQKTEQILTEYRKNIADGNYLGAWMNGIQLKDYEPGTAQVVINSSANPGDFFRVNTSRENAAIENRYGQENTKQNQLWKEQVNATEYERELKKKGIDNVYRQQNMILDTNLGLSAYLQKLRKEIELKGQYGLLKKNDQRAPSYVGDIKSSMLEIEDALSKDDDLELDDQIKKMKTIITKNSPNMDAQTKYSLSLLPIYYRAKKIAKGGDKEMLMSFLKGNVDEKSANMIANKLGVKF